MVCHGLRLMTGGVSMCLVMQKGVAKRSSTCTTVNARKVNTTSFTRRGQEVKRWRARGSHSTEFRGRQSSVILWAFLSVVSTRMALGAPHSFGLVGKYIGLFTFPRNLSMA